MLALRENGNLEVMSLPDFTVRYLIQNLNLAPNVLSDALFTASMPKSSNMSFMESSESLPKINEICMVALGKVCLTIKKIFWICKKNYCRQFDRDNLTFY